MKTKYFFLLVAAILLNLSALAQFYPHYQWTLLDQDQMDEIIGEASGETAFNHIIEMAGYNRDRLAEEYAGTLWEAEYVLSKLNEYGLDGAKIERFKSGRQTWNGIRGELWEVSPGKKKLADYDDLRAMLASGSQNADVEAELIWVEEGRQKDFDGLDVTDKIVVTSGSPGSVYSVAASKGAVGVISFYAPRPLVDPIQIPWSGVRGRRSGGGESQSAFAFFLPPREGYILRDRLLRGAKIRVHAIVEAENVDLDLQVPTCIIPGSNPDAGEVIFSAHLFEGYTKQGANDNISGSASILEVARMLRTMIDEGRLPQPERTIRFIWVPEFSGTIPWVNAHPDLMKNTLCNINLDMVGLWLSQSQSSFNLERTTYGNAHYINDVLENYFRYVGETNRVSLSLTGRGGYLNRIVAPSGTDEPFYYAIEHHYGSSDHEVFNDWGIGVPGVMLITWPDNYYHTSEDRTSHCDPTQLRRCCVISAASAYTIASADEKMVRKMAGEVFTNGSRRIGQQAARAFDQLSKATAENFSSEYKKCRNYIMAAKINEIETLGTLTELTPGNNDVIEYINDKTKLIDALADNQASGIDQLMKSMAKELGVKEPGIKPDKLEKKAMSITPEETALVKANGYSGYRSALSSMTSDNAMKYRSAIGNTSELQRLCNGKHNALDIKILLDTEYERETDLEVLLDYLQALKDVGLITF